MCMLGKVGALWRHFAHHSFTETWRQQFLDRSTLGMAALPSYLGPPAGPEDYK